MIWFTPVFCRSLRGGRRGSRGGKLRRAARASTTIGDIRFFQIFKIRILCGQQFSRRRSGGQVNRHFTALCIYLVIRFQLGGQAILRHRLVAAAARFENLRQRVMRHRIFWINGQSFVQLFRRALSPGH